MLGGETVVSGASSREVSSVVSYAGGVVPKGEGVLDRGGSLNCHRVSVAHLWGFLVRRFFPRFFLFFRRLPSTALFQTRFPPPMNEPQCPSYVSHAVCSEHVHRSFPCVLASKRLFCRRASNIKHPDSSFRQIEKMKKSFLRHAHTPVLGR